MIIAFAYKATKITPVMSILSHRLVSEDVESGHRASEGAPAGMPQTGQGDGVRLLR